MFFCEIFFNNIDKIKSYIGKVKMTRAKYLHQYKYCTLKEFRSIFKKT